MGAKAENLVWIDLEMTGLDTTRDHIIEIATLVTNSALELIAEGPILAIHQEDAVLEAMDQWNRTTHATTGLLPRVRASQLTAAEAERQTLEFLVQHAEKGASPMCGNSICQDRRFLAREMPELERFFPLPQSRRQHAQGARAAVGPGSVCRGEEDLDHLAIEDIRDSVRELEHYRRHLIRA
jgi:oligoribonuclease